MYSFPTPAASGLVPFATPINLDDAVAVLRACAQLPALPPESRVLQVDCHQLACQRTLGISHVVSQLLLLRRAGGDLCLHRVNPALHRCLQLLRLDNLFWIETTD